MLLELFFVGINLLRSAGNINDLRVKVPGRQILLIYRGSYRTPITHNLEKVGKSLDPMDAKRRRRTQACRGKPKEKIGIDSNLWLLF